MFAEEESLPRFRLLLRGDSLTTSMEGSGSLRLLRPGLGTLHHGGGGAVSGIGGRSPTKSLADRTGDPATVVTLLITFSSVVLSLGRHLTGA